MKTINVVTHMYSKSDSEHVPMYVEGQPEYQLIADYFHSFITSLCCNIDITLGSKAVSVDHYSEFGIKYLLSSDKADLELNFSVAPQRSPYLSDDIMQKVYVGRNWFVHHVDIDKVTVRDWISTEISLMDTASKIL